MRIIKMATVIVASLSGLLLAAPAGAVPPYPPEPAVLTVTPAVVEVGDVVTVVGTGFGPNDTVRITITTTDTDAIESADANVAGAASGTIERGRYNGGRQAIIVRADAQGSFTTSVRLRKEGIARFVAVGRPSGIRGFATVTVLDDDDDGWSWGGWGGWGWGGWGDEVRARQSASPDTTTRSTAVRWTKVAAEVLGGGVAPAAIGFALR